MTRLASTPHPFQFISDEELYVLLSVFWMIQQDIQMKPELHEMLFAWINDTGDIDILEKLQREALDEFRYREEDFGLSARSSWEYETLRKSAEQSDLNGKSLRLALQLLETDALSDY